MENVQGYSSTKRAVSLNHPLAIEICSNFLWRPRDLRELSFDAAGCLKNVTQRIEGKLRSETKYTCGQGGKRVARETTTFPTDGGKPVQSRVLQFAGIGEIRPDEGELLVRLPVNGTVLLEERYDLATGLIREEKSQVVFTDLRGSTLVTASYKPGEKTPPAVRSEAVYDPWGRLLERDGTTPDPLVVALPARHGSEHGREARFEGSFSPARPRRWSTGAVGAPVAAQTPLTCTERPLACHQGG
jgi:hypothetical protein